MLRPKKSIVLSKGRTNSLRNNSMQGAIVGAPGTFPTNWTMVDRGGLSHSVIGIGIEDGIDYIDVRISGTATSTITATRFLLFEADNNIASLNGQSWIGSVFVTLVGGSVANITFSSLLAANNTAPTQLTQNTIAFIPVAGRLALNRVSVPLTNTNASTAFQNLQFLETFSISTAIDITLRIGSPQLELVAGAFITKSPTAVATSPIRTMTSPATRAGR